MKSQGPGQSQHLVPWQWWPSMESRSSVSGVAGLPVLSLALVPGPSPRQTWDTVPTQLTASRQTVLAPDIADGGKVLGQNPSGHMRPEGLAQDDLRTPPPGSLSEKCRRPSLRAAPLLAMSSLRSSVWSDGHGVPVSHSLGLGIHPPTSSRAWQVCSVLTPFRRGPGPKSSG